MKKGKEKGQNKTVQYPKNREKKKHRKQKKVREKRKENTNEPAHAEQLCGRVDAHAAGLR